MDTATCEHERSHILDSKFHGSGYASCTSRRIFCDRCRLQRWLNVEVALALAQAELHIIPEEAAFEVQRAADLSKFDLCEVADGVARTGHSLMSLLRALQGNCSKSASEYVHFGATTQDIQDTAQSLEMREVLDAAEPLLAKLMDKLAILAKRHRTTLMAGRTHSIPALPTTFGLKVAGWIDELMRQRERLQEARKRVLVAQLFGGVGTLAALGNKGLAVLEVFARRLSLSTPLVGWHVSRDRVAEFVSSLAMMTATLARIADEIRTLNRWEIGEVGVGWSEHAIGSSTMPHKRNPEQCEQVVVLARLAKAQVMLALDAMILEHERDYRGTRLEWCIVADVSHCALAALELMLGVIGGLEIKSEVMEQHALAWGDAICSEALVFEMAKKQGKKSAYQTVFSLCQKSQSNHAPLREVLASDPEVCAAIQGESFERLLDPRAHLGVAENLVDRVLASMASGKK